MQDITRDQYEIDFSSLEKRDWNGESEQPSQSEREAFKVAVTQKRDQLAFTLTSLLQLLYGVKSKEQLRFLYYTNLRDVTDLCNSILNSPQ